MTPSIIAHRLNFLRRVVVTALAAGYVFFSDCPVIAQQQTETDSVAVEEESDGLADEEVDDIDDLFGESLESLSSARVTTPDLSSEVSTVSRTQTPIRNTPAAVFVVTNEMIRRSGARTVPDALRMVPGMHVAKLSDGNWSVGMRGKASQRTDDLLVQVDGRSIYNKSYGGTFWGAQGFVLEDIERIEVIRGPGASVWGANAVRGVINIVTKCSCKTQGLFVESAAGNELQYSDTIRYGGQTPWGHYRVWGKASRQDRGEIAGDIHDRGHFESSMAGIRMDLTETFFDKFTLDMGVLDSNYTFRKADVTPTAPFFVPPRDINVPAYSWHANMTASYDVSDEESYSVRGSYYVAEQGGPVLHLQPSEQTEVDFQHNLQPLPGHKLVWGANFHRSAVNLDSSFNLSSTMPEFEQHNYGLFVQDTFQLREKLAMTLGVKLSYNDLSGFEYQPTARLLFNADEQTALWTSVSRAVRTPTFRETATDFRLPPVTTAPFAVFPKVVGTPGLGAEDLLAVEVGIRKQPAENIYWDLSAYHFTFRDQISVSPIRTLGPGVGGTFDLSIPSINLPGTTEVAGAELYGKYGVSDTWKISGNYSYHHNLDTGFSFFFPRNSAYLQSSHSLGSNVELDLIWRYRDNTSVSAYNTADVRLSWQVNDSVQLTIAGLNLLRPGQFEEGTIEAVGNVPAANQRSLFGMVQCRF